MGNKDAGNLSMQESVSPAQNEMYADFIVKYMDDFQEDLGDVPGFSFQKINGIYGVVYAPLTEIGRWNINTYSYSSIPKCYTHMDLGGLSASGITRLQEHPYLQLKGSGTAVAVVNSGIDYRNPVFQNEMGSRILCIWDQTLEGDGKEVPYGRVFWKKDIDQALASGNPLEIVPSVDTDGHGTRMAAIAAGNYFPEENFSGAAPEAMLIIVKVKPAKKYLREFYLFPAEAELFQENDIMMGIKYLRVIADRFRRPLVTLLGLGTNYGSHTGTSPLSQVTQNYGGFFGIATVIAAGNETGLAHHYAGRFSADTSFEDVELRVGEEEGKRGFILELWSSAADLYTVGFVSPGGERISRIPILSNNETRIPFLLESTVITVSYQLIEAGSGSQLVSMRFERPSPGIWTIRVYNTQFLTGEYHMWLPVQGFISDETVFLKPDPSNTITVPGNSRLPITTGAYNHRNNSIYIHSSRGYTSRDYVKPDLAAPGVEILGPSVRISAAFRPGLSSSVAAGTAPAFSRRTGTSAAAAITAGAVANLLSWGIVMGNYPTMSEASIKSYLIRGAARNPSLTYPNKEFGYGTLDLLQTFLRLRE